MFNKLKDHYFLLGEFVIEENLSMEDAHKLLKICDQNKASELISFSVCSGGFGGWKVVGRPAAPDTSFVIDCVVKVKEDN